MLTILSEFDEDSCLEVPVSIKTIMHTLFFFFKLSVILPIKLDYLLNILIPICHESSFLRNKSLALFSAIFLYFLSVFLILICFCFIVCVSKTKTNYLLNLPNLQLFVLSLLIFAFVAILNNKLLLVLGGWNFLVVLLNLSKNLRLNVYEQSKNKFLKPKRTQRIINKNFIQNVFLLTAMNLVLMSSTLLIFVELIQHDLNLILLFVLFIIFMFIFAIFIETVALLAA